MDRDISVPVDIAADPGIRAGDNEGDSSGCRAIATDRVRVPARSGSRVAIVVAGAHRSGTSLIAHLLAQLGALLPEDRVAASAGNPLGHWEPRRLVALNDRILATFGRGAEDPRPMPSGWASARAASGFVDRIAGRIEHDYGDAALLLIKDPRICRLLPLYALALDKLAIEMRVIHCVRHPAEVVRSLAARDGIGTSDAALLWLRYMLEAEQASRPYCRGWTSYAATLDDCERVLGALGRSLGFPWLAEMERIGFAPRAIVLREERHWVEDRQDYAGPDMPFLQGVWDAARQALAGHEAAAIARFDESRALLMEFDRYHAHYEHRLDAIHASTCWRATAPLRALAHAVRHGQQPRPRPV